MELQLQEIQSILPTKENVDTASNYMADQVKEGLVNPIEAIVKVTAMEQLCKAVRSKIEGEVLDSLNLNSGKQSFEGAKIERCEVAVSYDFSHDSTWNEMKVQMDRLKEAMKMREDVLKKIPAGKMLVDNETGETLIGAAKESKTSFKVSLAR